MNIKETISAMRLEDKAKLCIDGALWRTRGFPEYDIPILNMSDGTNGLRHFRNQAAIDPTKTIFRENMDAKLDTAEGQSITDDATCFPTGSAMACSWDTDLAEEVAAAVANECKGHGVGMLFGPGLNIRRHPLDGRGFEYYSEDPCLAGEMAGHYVIGLQQHDVAGCLKHFACNNSNYMRTIYDSVVEERALREIYLAAFERAIRVGKPAAVMSSYNLINGIQASENPWLLTQVLRNDWNFEGMVISDSSAIKNPLAAFSAGLDWQMPYSESAAQILVDAVCSGELSEEVLDMHCARILKTVEQYSRQNKPLEPIDFEANHTLARKAARNCAVLLQNRDNLLPFQAGSVRRIAVLGDVAVHPVFQGSGCARVPAMTVDIPLEEIRALCPESVEIVYAPGYNADDTTDDSMLEEAAKLAASCDAAVVFAAARLPLETDDYNRSDMRLQESHNRLIEAVGAVQQNTAVVLCHGEAVELPWVDSVKSILDMWYTGEGSGHAVAELLFGHASPCGKLAVTFPIRLEDTPGYLNFPGENYKLPYEEGIFVGYRYYEKRKMQTRFPFGHGLSYTQFAYTDLQVSAASTKVGDPVHATLTITNTGNVPGAEVVQCYVRDTHSRLKRPEKELKHFAKVYLQPGESKTVTFDFCERDFAYYDPAYGGWIVDSGEFVLLFGASSADIRLSAVVTLESTQKYMPPIRTEMHFNELFSYPNARNVFYKFLEDLQQLKPEDNCKETDQLFLTNFWGIAEYLDYMLPHLVTPQMMRKLVYEMKRAEGICETYTDGNT